MRGQRSLLLGPTRLCLRLLLLLGYRRRCPPLLRGLVQRWRYGKVCLRSLLYNSFGGSDTAVDAAFEPIYWLVDNVIRWCGVVSDAQGAGKGMFWGSRTCVWWTHLGFGTHTNPLPQGNSLICSWCWQTDCLPDLTGVGRCLWCW